MRQLLKKKHFSFTNKKQHFTNDIIHWQGQVKRISRELGNIGKWEQERHSAFTCENTMLCAFRNKLCITEKEKMGRETHAASTPENAMFFAVWKKLRIREKNNGTGSTKCTVSLWCVHIFWSCKLCCGNITHYMLLILFHSNCARHWLFTSKCLLSVSRPIFFQSLIRNWFQAAQNIVFSQVRATFVLPGPFFLFPNSQLIPNCKKHCVFTGKCCMCPSSHFFLVPNSQLISKCTKHCVFTGKRCMPLSSHFSYIP